MKNIWKLIVSKPMKRNKNADTFFFLLLLTRSERFFVSAGAQKRWRAAGSGNTLLQSLPNPKNKSKIYMYIKSKIKIKVYIFT